MKVMEYIRLAECALCFDSDKKLGKKLKCQWNGKSESCDKIKECGAFSTGIGNIGNVEIP